MRARAKERVRGVFPDPASCAALLVERFSSRDSLSTALRSVAAAAAAAATSLMFSRALR